MQEQQIRNQILEAAAKRFTHYGYSKTTVAEIAGDCGMSSGNLYRYFENKEAIARAAVEEKLEEKSRVCESAPDSAAPAIEQIRQYLLARLRFSHALSCGSAHIFELVQLMTDRHKELLDKYDGRMIEWIGKIIEHGIARKEFRPLEVERTAGSIFVATMVFCIPIFMQESLPAMESRLNDLLDLLYEGLRA